MMYLKIQIKYASLLVSSSEMCVPVYGSTTCPAHPLGAVLAPVWVLVWKISSPEGMRHVLLLLCYLLDLSIPVKYMDKLQFLGYCLRCPNHQLTCLQASFQITFLDLNLTNIYPLLRVKPYQSMSKSTSHHSIGPINVNQSHQTVYQSIDERICCPYAIYNN